MGRQNWKSLLNVYYSKQVATCCVEPWLSVLVKKYLWHLNKVLFKFFSTAFRSVELTEFLPFHSQKVMLNRSNEAESSILLKPLCSMCFRVTSGAEFIICSCLLIIPCGGSILLIWLWLNLIWANKIKAQF